MLSNVLLTTFAAGVFAGTAAVLLAELAVLVLWR